MLTIFTLSTILAPPIQSRRTSLLFALSTRASSTRWPVSNETSIFS